MLQKKPGRFCSRCWCPPGGGRCPRWHRTRRSGARPASSEVWLEWNREEVSHREMTDNFLHLCHIGITLLISSPQVPTPGVPSPTEGTSHLVRGWEIFLQPQGRAEMFHTLHICSDSELTLSEGKAVNLECHRAGSWE